MPTSTKLPAEERQAYLDDWSQPGALTAMLNWYRASKIVVPAPGEEADGAALDPRALPEAEDADAGGLGPEGQRPAPGPARRAATI